MTAPFDIPNAPISDDEAPEAEVVDLYEWMSSRLAAGAAPNGPPSTGNASDVRYQAPAVRPRVRQARPTPLDVAVAQLATARDKSRDPVERSNSFDTWRNILRSLAKNANTEAFRELLGLLLAATHKKDAGDLDDQTLAVLLDATTRLKSQPAAIDINRVSAALRGVGATGVIPLSADGLSEEVTRELEELIEAAEQNRL
jgi:hypothetical protein